MLKKRDIQPEDFEMFLTWLASEPDEACQKYEKIRLRLIKVFVCRGCSDPDYLADETIDRVVGKIRQLRDDYIGDSPIKYIYGVARNVYLEFLRQDQNTQAALKMVRFNSDAIEGSKSYCLDHCLEQLPDDQTRIFLDYFQNDDKPKKQIRRELADKFNLELNALRVKIYRARHFLQNCLRECLNKK